MGFAVLRNGGIGLVHRFRHGQRLLRLHVTQARVLKEMPPEGVAAVAGRLVAGRNPRAALDQVVLRIESRRGEVIVAGMDLKPVKARNRRFRPLPDIADEVEKFPEGETIHRARRGPVFQIDVPRGLLPIGLVRDIVQVPQSIPLGLGRQPQGLAGLARQPVAEGLGLEVIHLNRPIPGHVDDLGHGPQAVARAGLPAPRGKACGWRLDPEQGVPGLAVAGPFPALVRPVALVFVTPLFDEAQVLPIGNQVTAGREVPDFVFLAAEFVVPSIERVVLGLAQHDPPSGDRDQLVPRRIARFRADPPQRQRPDHLDG